MICKNCGKEFEGKFCPHCGHDSSKPTKAETAEKRKAAAGKLKEKLKPATDFVKKHKLLVIIVAAVLVAAIIVGTTLGVVLSNDFRVGKMNQIKIGMTKAEVKEKLGEPHEDEASTWFYYSKNYKKLIDEAKKLMGDGEDTGDEDMSEEDFESALGDLDSTLKKLEELEAKAAALLHDEIRISFSDDKVTAVEMLKDFSEETKDAKKEVKKAKLGVEEVQRFTTLKTPVYAIVEYTDGSYRNAPVVLKEQPNTENEGKTQVTWHDLWSDTDVTAEINVVKNPNIYKQGKLDYGVEYFIFEVDGGYSLSFLGNGEIENRSNEYPWDDIKDKITSVTIGNGVTSIDSFAFSGCNGLTIYAEAAAEPNGWGFINWPVVWDYKNNDVADDGYIYTIQNGIRYGIKDGAAKVAGQPSNITEANIASEIIYKETRYSVTSIGYDAFSGCNSLTSIAIPDSVTSIGYNAFSGCSSLTELKMPAEVAGVYGAKNVTKIAITGGTSIRDSAFEGCSSLTSIAIPNGVTSIGDNAFYGCSGLETITVAEGNTKYHSAGNCLIETATKILIQGCKTSIIPTDGSVTSIGYEAFAGCSSLTSIAIPDSVTSIGYSAFYECSNLTSIAIPDSVTSIGSQAFYYCSSLTSIAIGNSVTSIGTYAFYGCSSLTSIAIPDSVTSIGNYAFRGCSSLTSIIIGNGLTSIGDDAFDECISLETLTVAEGNTKYHSAGNCIIETATKILIQGCKTSIIPTDGSVTSIGYEAFEGCSSLTSIEIPNGVTSIGSSAFKGTGIWNNAAENSVVYADKWAIGYKGDKATLSGALTLKADTVGIGREAFEGCSSLTSIAIPDSVTSIGYEAFDGCSRLQSITIPFVGATKDGTSNTYFGYIFGASKYSDNNTHVPNSLKEVIITGDTSIGKYAFYGCSRLQSITIPFVGATKDGTSNTHFGYIFGASSSNYNDDYVPINLKEVIITGGTSIGSYAFENCSSLLSIAIPDSVKSIGDRAFYRCSRLTSIAIPDSVTSIGYFALYGTAIWNNTADNSVIYADKWAVGYKGDKGTLSGALTLKADTVGIGSGAFYGCSSLTSIAIPDSVTSICNRAFYYCSSLTSIEFQGTKAEWKAITKGSEWNYNTGEYTVTCTDGTLGKWE